MIDPGDKRCLCIQAGLNRREASCIVTGREGGGGTICTGDQLYVHRAKQPQKILPQVGSQITIPVLERKS